MKINWFPFALVFYMESLPNNRGGDARGFIVRIKDKHAGDKGILAHELEHVVQAWRGLLIIHALLYLFVRRYRLWAEVQAYREQMQHPRADGTFMETAEAAYRLSGARYDLGLSVEQAVVELSE